MFQIVEDTKYGKLYKSNAQYVLDNLQFGIDEAFKNKNLALVTGPISKENIISINKDFSGHTEYIQQRTKSAEVLMLLASNQLKSCISNYSCTIKKRLQIK
jgi:4-hydroxythreonine-4-phosphate dehydrogenase